MYFTIILINLIIFEIPGILICKGGLRPYNCECVAKIPIHNAVLQWLYNLKKYIYYNRKSYPKFV